jgi:hypothetical protein
MVVQSSRSYTQQYTRFDLVCCFMYNMDMIYSFKEALKTFGSRYQIRKALFEKRIFVIKRGYYSDEKPLKDEAALSIFYPGAIFTLNSAFFLYDLTDTIPDYFYVASLRTYVRIKDKDVKQSYQEKEIFALGTSSLKTPTGMVRIYDKERLLIELIRFQKRLPYDYYKEIIGNYRKISYLLDSNKIAAYTNHFKNGETILRQIMREVF